MVRASTLSLHLRSFSERFIVVISSSLCAICSQQVGCHRSPSFSILCQREWLVPIAALTPLLCLPLVPASSSTDILIVSSHTGTLSLSVARFRSPTLYSKGQMPGQDNILSQYVQDKTFNPDHCKFWTFVCLRITSIDVVYW